MLAGRWNNGHPRQLERRRVGGEGDNAHRDALSLRIERFEVVFPVGERRQNRVHLREKRCLVERPG
jgi:hypothetical protein